MTKIYQKSFLGVKNVGFTLIELLVVVLIIGILAAVAVSQYQQAVNKARLSEIVSVLRLYRDAEETYYMANGKYTDYPADLDVEIPFKKIVSNLDGGYFITDKNYWFSLIGTNGNPDLHYVQGGFGRLEGDSYSGIKKELAYTLYLQHSSYPGKISCWGTTDAYQQLCKSLDLGN